MKFLLKLAALGSIVLAFLSAYPGILIHVIFVGMFFAPILIAGLCVIRFVFFRRARSAKKATFWPQRWVEDAVGATRGGSARWRWIVSAPAVMVLSFVMIPTGIPMRLGFFLSRSAFQRQAAEAVSAGGSQDPERYLGVYYVDRAVADLRGGIYFRTHTGPDGLGPNRMSYGFAFRPNPWGTPFGRARYGYSHLGGGWYVFEVSD